MRRFRLEQWFKQEKPTPVLARRETIMRSIYRTQVMIQTIKDRISIETDTKDLEKSLKVEVRNLETLRDLLHD